MTIGWNGADPVQQADASAYELGTEYVANVDITITAVRVWEGASPATLTNRRGRIWSTGGGLLGSGAMPTTLPSGWSTYTLDAPVTVTAGVHFVVSYGTGGNYGALVHGLDSAVPSSDGSVTAVAGASGVHGNGSFAPGTPGVFPTTASGNNSFFGIDIVFTASGNTPPRITNFTVAVSGTQATATITAVDDQTLSGAVYAFNWGDGASTSGASNTAQHTYSGPGVWAVLGSVTDNGGLSAFAAQPADIEVTSTGGFDAQGVVNSLVSIAQETGLFAVVNNHEPVPPPPSGLTAAIWPQTIGPAQKVSGLSATAAHIAFLVRLYMPTTTGQLDAIDPAMVTATSTLIGLFTGGFTLGATVFEVDLFGAHGPKLAGKAGYLNQAGQLFRIIDITVPLVIDNVWTQAP